ncbi:PepSY-associated TM helix domain-containing protein [Sphingomonas gellani]|uniref:PepSY-associated TM helix domain-containing protein n=1 Tax=Sphingomonas gellani TaxID=1166340 RepID=UPI0014811CD3|nr:PepSY-associated TM helix domain-containing protein [Sphingomonas gellani]
MRADIPRTRNQSEDRAALTANLHAPSRSAASRTRILLRRLHLCLGLSLGLLFALLGATGSMLVFYTDIDAALHPAVHSDHAGSTPDLRSPAWDRALATGRARWHDAGGKWSFEVTNAGEPIQARYYPAPGHRGEREMVWFSPDGSRILRAEPWGGYLMSWIYELHMQLLAGAAGEQVVGWSGVAMMFLLVSGMAAWWPRGTWRKAIAVKRGAAPIRRIRDLHKLSGLASFGLLLVLVATGVLLALPPVTQALFRPTAIPDPKPIVHRAEPIDIVHALAVAQRAMPDGRLRFFDMPSAPDAPIRARFQVPGDPHRRFPGSYVFIDRFSAKILAVHDVRNGNTGTQWVSWVRPLHDGSVCGLATRMLAVLIGLTPAFLFGSGLLHWLRRRSAARAARGA